MKKWIIFVLVLVLTAALAACSSSDASTKKVRIGYQKNGTTLLLKGNGDLEKRLNDLGYEVEWSEFNTASSILEALNSGAIDFANAGDAPSVMALSKGMKFKYIATEDSAPQGEGILVKSDGGIASIADLKGKKIAYNKASIAEYLLVSALASENLTLNDVESVILTPADASVAFENGEVDAWVTWDPYMTISENKGNKILTTGEGFVVMRSFYITSEEFAKSHEDAVKAYVEEVAKIGESIDKNSNEAATILEENTGIEVDVWKTSLGRRSSVAHFIDDAAIKDLQTLHDDLLSIQLIDSEIENINDHIWQP